MYSIDNLLNRDYYHDYCEDFSRSKNVCAENGKKKKKESCFSGLSSRDFCLSCHGDALWADTGLSGRTSVCMCPARPTQTLQHTLTNGQYGAFKKWSSHLQTSTPTVTRVSRCSGPRNLQVIYEFVEKGQHLSSQIGKPALHLETLLSPQLTLCIMFASFEILPWWPHKKCTFIFREMRR